MFVVVEGGGGLRFLPEALVGVAVSGQLRRQELQRDESIETEILRLVDDTHAAATELLEDSAVRNRPSLESGSSLSPRVRRFKP
jgi:hypothetical protein